MAYLVKTIKNNGYRCGCCNRTLEYEEWIEDRAGALAKVPLIRQYSEEADSELEEISVIDGNTGVEIAHGQLTWHGLRALKYSHHVWRGHVEGVLFEEITGALPGETWEDVVKRLDTPPD